MAVIIVRMSAFVNAQVGLAKASGCDDVQDMQQSLPMVVEEFATTCSKE
ncbi:MAG: hypothetical protein WBV46_15025 [Terriglobales bacterium]